MSEEESQLGFGESSVTNLPLQYCPNCGSVISAMPGSRDAVCTNCGYKDPCCGD